MRCSASNRRSSGRSASSARVERDDVVPLASSQRLYDAWGGPKRWVAIPEANHDDLGLQPTFWEPIRAFLGATKSRLAGVSAGALVRHHVSNLRIAVAGPTDATGAAYFFVITQHGPDHWGRYRDRYVCVDGNWRFAHRRVRLDGGGGRTVR